MSAFCAVPFTSMVAKLVAMDTALGLPAMFGSIWRRCLPLRKMLTKMPFLSLRPFTRTGAPEGVRSKK
eukprot:6263004-Alexandrium_andersonii.AAC.1